MTILSESEFNETFPLIIIHWPYRQLPYYWDAMGYVFPHAREIYDAGLFPILRNWDVGHPTAYFWLLAVAMKIVGVNPLAGHLLALAFGAMFAVTILGCCRILGCHWPLASAVSLAALSRPLK